MIRTGLLVRQELPSSLAQYLRALIDTHLLPEDVEAQMAEVARNVELEPVRAVAIDDALAFIDAERASWGILQDNELAWQAVSRIRAALTGPEPEPKPCLHEWQGVGPPRGEGDDSMCRKCGAWR